MQVKDLIVTGDAKILGNLYTKDGNVGAGGGAGGGEGGSSITYRLTKSGQTITLTGSDGSTSSVVDSDTTTSVDLSGYLPKSGGTMTGALNFKNGTWNTLGDDVYFGDNDTAGSFAIKGANGTTNLKMVANNSSAYGTLSWNGSQFVSSNNFTAPAFIENGTALSSKYAPISHSHDDRYFTESEINSKLKGYSTTGHSHDDRYFTESEINTKLSGYSTTGHNHDDRYFTESEINSKLNDLKKSVSEGKSLVAAAVTNKGVNTAANATFQTIANNINSISTTLSFENLTLVGSSNDNDNHPYDSGTFNDSISITIPDNNTYLVVIQTGFHNSSYNAYTNAGSWCGLYIISNKTIISKWDGTVYHHTGSGSSPHPWCGVKNNTVTPTLTDGVLTVKIQYEDISHSVFDLVEETMGYFLYKI